MNADDYPYERLFLLATQGIDTRVETGELSDANAEANTFQSKKDHEAPPFYRRWPC